ncbi:MAG: helix-turn-helix domain-containing protein [Salinibacterium sp.]|nr:helix-turn-helix domain-containing protein [Salinibacterium sp.]MBF0673172.1 helix-turn-helix domain-containing protein [Salinibacterium sp.]
MTTTADRHEGDGFTMIPDWLVESSAISLHDYAVLIVLMKHARSSGQCHPGFATIAAQARLSRDSVMRSLRSLEERGLISIERRRVGAKNLPNLYTLHVERGRVVAHSDHSKGGRSQQVVAHSDQAVAYSNQGWSLPATLTRPTNETYEPDTVASDELVSDDISAIERRDAASAVVLDIDTVFDRVWGEWPKKTSRKTARAKFHTAAQRHPGGLHGLADDAIAHGRAHGAHTPERFVPMLSTWLNGDRWDDALPHPRSGDTVADRNAAIFARYLGPDGGAT